jgi:hypothetical protein
MPYLRDVFQDTVLKHQNLLEVDPTNGEPDTLENDRFRDTEDAPAPAFAQFGIICYKRV